MPSAKLVLRYRCASCGRDATGRPAAMPCLCGQILRARVDTADSYVLPGRASLRYDQSKDWQLKYVQLARNVRELRNRYAPARTDQAQLRHLIETAFQSCAALGDWLLAGPEPRTITQGGIERLMASDPLRVCRALAAGSGARLVPVYLGSQSRAWIEFVVPGVRPVRFDALDLAERCLAAWNSFLREHKVALPQWQHS